MANIVNIWYNVTQWFRDRHERKELIKEWNTAAKHAYIFGEVPTLLEASISKGYSPFRHSHSKLYSGFRIKVFAGKSLSKDEIKIIGVTIICDPTLMRRLVVLGFDTLEVYGSENEFGLHWPIKDFLQLNSTFD